WVLMVWAVLIETTGDWEGMVTLGIAVLATGLALLPMAPRASRAGWAVAAAITWLAWPPIEFVDTARTVAWTGILLAGALTAYRLRHPTLTWGTLAGAGLLSFQLWFDETPALQDGEINVWLGAAVFLAATTALALAWRSEVRGEPRDPLKGRIFLALAVAAPMAFVVGAVDGFAISIGWAAVGFLLVTVGFLADLRDVRLASFGVFGLVLARVFLVDMGQLDLGLRIVTFLVVGALLLAASFLYARATGRREPG
ncbi:MAG: DUF2339 domain-containing protein, partial [Candidatus Thermoplasmatota archaeon]|nr:DUF2339 domain-containing protein [Candidatus Thermoplasmatota archaeon]